MENLNNQPFFFHILFMITPIEKLFIIAQKYASKINLYFLLLSAKKLDFSIEIIYFSKVF